MNVVSFLVFIVLVTQGKCFFLNICFLKLIKFNNLLFWIIFKLLLKILFIISCFHTSMYVCVQQVKPKIIKLNTILELKKTWYIHLSTLNDYEKEKEVNFVFNLGPHVSEAQPLAAASCWFGLQQPGITGVGGHMDPYLNTLADCELKCFNEEWCLAFSFLDETSTCRVHGNLDTMYEAGSAYYKKTCTTVLGEFKNF